MPITNPSKGMPQGAGVTKLERKRSNPDFFLKGQIWIWSVWDRIQILTWEECLVLILVGNSEHVARMKDNRHFLETVTDIDLIYALERSNNRD